MTDTSKLAAEAAAISDKSPAIKTFAKDAAANLVDLAGRVAALEHAAPIPTPTPTPTPAVSRPPVILKTSPPNQAAPTTSGFKTFANISAVGPNCGGMPKYGASSAFTSGRTIDAYATPEWWHAFQIKFPNEWPWTVGGYRSWCIYFNAHSTPADPTWSWMQQSPVWIYSNGSAGVAGTQRLLWELQQEDGQPHPFAQFADVPLGVWVPILVRIRYGLSDATRWSAVVNQQPSRATGLIQAWVGSDILHAPSNPTFDSDVFAATIGQPHIGTIRVAVNPANGQRTAEQFYEYYEGQLYTPSYTEDTFNNSGTAHIGYEVMRMGQTMAACLGEDGSKITWRVTDNSSYAGFTAKGGVGTNYGDHTATIVTDPALLPPAFPVPA